MDLILAHMMHQMAAVGTLSRVIVMSATMDVPALQESLAAPFGGNMSPVGVFVLQAPEAPPPVTPIHSAELNLGTDPLDAVMGVLDAWRGNRSSPEASEWLCGHYWTFLVFVESTGAVNSLVGRLLMRSSVQSLRNKLEGNHMIPRGAPIDVVGAHGRMDETERAALVDRDHSRRGMRFVVGTDYLESSVSLKHTVFVVDTGMRVVVSDLGGVTIQSTAPISLNAADQRRGRAFRDPEDLKARGIIYRVMDDPRTGGHRRTGRDPMLLKDSTAWMSQCVLVPLIECAINLRRDIATLHLRGGTLPEATVQRAIAVGV